MHQDEAAVGLNHLPHMFAGSVVRRDGSADCDATILGDFRGHVSDAADVDVAMLFREAEFGRQVFAHQIAIEQRDWTATGFEKLREQDVGDGRLARAGKAGEEDGDGRLS